MCLATVCLPSPRLRLCARASFARMHSRGFPCQRICVCRAAALSCSGAPGAGQERRSDRDVRPSTGKVVNEGIVDRQHSSEST